MKRSVGGAVAALLVVAWSAAATADGFRVVVATSASDPQGARLEKELRAMGFDVTRVEGRDCSRDAMAAAMNERGAAAAACSEGNALVVWTPSDSGAKMRDTVVAESDETRDKDVAAVRAAEIVRASLSMPVDALPPPMPPEREPVVVVVPRPAETVNLRDAPPAPETPIPFTPTFYGSAAIGALMGTAVTVPTVNLKLAVPVQTYVLLAARCDLPVGAQALVTSSTSRTVGADVKPGFAGLSAEVPLARVPSFVIPRLGGGVGLAWLHVEGRPPSGGTNVNRSQSATLTPQTETVFSPAFYTDLEISMRVWKPVRLVLDLTVGATAGKLVASADLTPLTRWSQPFGSVGTGVEIQVP